MKKELSFRSQIQYKCDNCSHIWMDSLPDVCPECYSANWHEHKFPIPMVVNDKVQMVDFVVENLSNEDNQGRCTIAIHGAGIYFDLDADACNQTMEALEDMRPDRSHGTPFWTSPEEWADWLACRLGFKGDSTDLPSTEALMREGQAMCERLVNGEALFPENIDDINLIPTIKQLCEEHGKVYVDGCFYDRDEVEKLLEKFG